MSGRDGLHSLSRDTSREVEEAQEEVEEEEEGGVRGRVAIGADSRVLRPRGGRLAARRDGEGDTGEGERAHQAKGDRERERNRAGARKKERDGGGERRKSAPNMQQEKKNWRSIGSSW